MHSSTQLLACLVIPKPRGAADGTPSFRHRPLDQDPPRSLVAEGPGGATRPRCGANDSELRLTTAPRATPRLDGQKKGLEAPMFHGRSDANQGILFHGFPVRI